MSKQFLKLKKPAQRNVMFKSYPNSEVSELKMNKYM